MLACVRRRALSILMPLALPALWLACSSSSSSSTPATIPDTALGGSCGAAVVHAAPTSEEHVPVGTVVAYPTNPPCGGDHYAIWATWGVHTQPLPPGYWVHDLEHGGVVMLYRCANRAACPELATKVEAVAAALPADPLCDASTRTRVVVLPDPDLPAGVEIAAASWGYAWTASCFDGDRLRAFALAAIGHAPEDTCEPGSVGDDAGSDAAGDGEVGGDAIGADTAARDGGAG
jgi:hypothetical protein